MTHVYVLEHVRADDEYRESAKFIGVFSEEAGAQAAIARLLPLPGFRDHPAGFEISKCELDKGDGWAEGFISWDEASA
jgi:hypothetical protein